jgi:hypothetical protein
MTPPVTVLMPVRNGLPWLREALESLASQTMGDFELLVLEDGSTDGTAEFLAAWSDHRLRVIPTRGIGMAAALNLGLDAARAPLVARHDADDVSAPHRLEAQVAYLASRPDVGVVATAADYIDAHGRAIDNDWVRTVRIQHDAALTPEQVAALMPLTCCVTHGSIMARAEVLRAAGGYQRGIWPVEDYDLWLRLLPETALAKLPERLYRYRIHDAQLSGHVRDRQLVEALSAKFRYLRRVVPQLPTPARLTVVGEGRGADGYRSLASAHGFRVVRLPPSRHALRRPGKPDSTMVRLKPDSTHGFVWLNVESGFSRTLDLDSCDALVVADLADVDSYSLAFGASTPHAAAIRIGNFFIPRRWAGRQAA